MKQYETATLDCGLRVIHLPDASNVVYCGFQIAAGARHEQNGDEGLAHFCEHMSFKGTQRRTALQVVNRLEQVGGEVNAFTTKDSTVYHCAVSGKYVSRAIDLLADMVFCSSFPEEAIKKEVEVICDEIESYNDSPAELIYDEFENMLFAQHALGHNILGNAERVRTFTRSDALRFTKAHYQPCNTIFFSCGNVSLRTVVAALQKALKDYPSALPRKAAPASEIRTPQTARHKWLDMNTHQAHVMLGCRTFSVHHKLRMPLYLINNVLGGPAMNALLNIALRERQGLVYTVESTMVSYEDTGMWAVYFGCDPKDTQRCLTLVKRELRKISQRGLTPRQLSAAKKQLIGQIDIACDNREQFALDFGKSFLHYGWEKNVDELCRNIHAIDNHDIMEVAQQLFREDCLSLLVIK